MSKKITVIGSANIDFIMKAPHLPELGETVTDCTYMQAFGGKGANQAMAAARAGGDVSFVAALGNDVYTDVMLKNFQAAGMKTDTIAVEKDIPSGSALIIFDAQGDNYITVAPGSNYRLSPEVVKDHENLIAESEWIVMQNEIPTDTIHTAFELAEKHKVKLMFNYAPLRDLSVKSDSAVYALVVNEVEAAGLTGKDEATIDLAEARNLAVSVREKGGHNFVCLTLGKDGAIISADGLLTHIPVFQVDPVDATAAGDTFCGAMAVALAEGAAIPEAARFASAASALAVSKMGAQPSIPLRSEIDSFLKANS